MPKKSKTQYGRIYPHYLFAEHDPVMDQIQTMVDGSNLSTSALAAESGVSAGTLYSWRKRKTKRPQFATVAAIARTLGGNVVVQRRSKTR